MSDYLVDASVWAEYLRGGKTAIKERLDKLLDENRAATSGIVLAELLTGIGNEEDRRFLEECFLGLPFVEATHEIFAMAGAMGSAIHEKGMTMPVSDLLIAALAKAHSLTVLTMDKRFLTLARFLGVQTERIKGF